MSPTIIYNFIINISEFSKLFFLESFQLVCWQHNVIIRKRTCQVQLPLPLHAPRPARQKYSASVSRAVTYKYLYNKLVGSSVCEVILLNWINMSWQDYVDKQLLASKCVTKAAIAGHDGNVWAKSENFDVSTLYSCFGNRC